MIDTYLYGLMGTVANVLDCDIVGREFEHQSSYYVYFRRNTLGKGMNHLISLVTS